MSKVNQIISETISRWPDRCSVVQDEAHWTYGELANQFSLLRHRLQDAGLSKRDRAVIWLNNSAQYIAAYLAVLEAESVVVAMHPLSPVSDIIRAVRQVGAAGLITSNKAWDQHHQVLEQSGIGFALLPEKTVLLTKEAKGEPAPEGLAQIVFTSGTTGEPKGVMLSHDNLVENTNSILACLKLESSDAIVAVLPFVFVYGNSVMLTHLFAGAKIIVPNSLIYPNVIIDWMKRERATGFSGVASNFALMFRQAEFHADNLPAMRYFTSAGGPMPSELLNKVRQAFPGRDFHVMYGQTEATARLTMLPPADLDRKKGSAGRSVPGVTITITGENGRILPAGEIGEITIAGTNVMQGYWKNPSATSTVLKNGQLYTGDLGRLDEEGYLYITGRNSEMIKSGAFRVAPSEIEDVLFEHPDVYEAGVVGVEDELLGEVIIGAVAVKSGSSTSEYQLLAHCAARLPSYKRPKAIFILPSLPKSANGKVLRQPLREQMRSLYGHSQNAAAVQNAHNQA
jgi:long-chain acyl-CoA synthetase